MVRALVASLLFSLTLFSCSQTTSSGPRTIPAYRPQAAPSPLEQKVSVKPSVESPRSLPVDPYSLDRCTRHLLFADQYLTVADYYFAEKEVNQAAKYCSPDDPRYNYMKALVLDAYEKRQEAFKYYYKAAKGYIEAGDMDSAFKAYSGLLSINPNSKEVKELQKYFVDEDY